MIVNLNTRRILAQNPIFVHSFWQQLLTFGTRRFHIPNCDAIVLERRRCLFIGFLSRKVDVIFVNADQQICGLHRSIPPGKLLLRCPNATRILLLPRGAIAAGASKIGHRLNISLELDPQTAEKLLLTPN